jgi:hypothetical protein
MIGFKADPQGYGSYAQCTNPGAPISGCAQGNLFTYIFGPELKFRIGKLEPFAEVFRRCTLESLRQRVQQNQRPLRIEIAEQQCLCLRCRWRRRFRCD